MTARALILPALRRTAADAQRFATIVHEGQVDKAGRPYVEHLSRVDARVFAMSAGCPFWSNEEVDEARQIAWLHDAVEDTSYGYQELLMEGFSKAVCLAVSKLTRHEAAINGSLPPYREWIASLAENGDLPTILVKLADVEDNSDPERLALLPEETRARLLRKYEPAQEVLRAAARRKGWQG